MFFGASDCFKIIDPLARGKIENHMEKIRLSWGENDVGMFNPQFSCGENKNITEKSVKERK